ncbi:hypothetical protein NIIDNTM18_29530 [Mycolicibacterium litorale]|uniref:Uncharacterized protein n=1 Tax=Mycolicibacterium litorale TaxID=758802 RepID=A0A6S6P547_9MYCO|nr:hypothetical protein NIIDNTM18_29530 [Mycolicibacterium litorale]
MTESPHAVIARLSTDFAAISRQLARVSSDLTQLDRLLSGPAPAPQPVPRPVPHPQLSRPVLPPPGARAPPPPPPPPAARVPGSVRKAGSARCSPSRVSRSP